MDRATVRMQAVNRSSMQNTVRTGTYSLFNCFVYDLTVLCMTWRKRLIFTTLLHKLCFFTGIGNIINLLTKIALIFRQKKSWPASQMCKTAIVQWRCVATFTDNFTTSQSSFILEVEHQTRITCSWVITLIEVIIPWKLSHCLWPSRFVKMTLPVV